VFPNCFHDVVL